MNWTASPPSPAEKRELPAFGDLTVVRYAGGTGREKKHGGAGNAAVLSCFCFREWSVSNVCC
jgi:hypothetical protein